MSNKEQNSIEWLFERINMFCMFTDGIPDEWSEALEHAKAMHKEETCQFVSDYLDDADYGMTAEEYYDQIYGGNDEKK